MAWSTYSTLLLLFADNTEFSAFPSISIGATIGIGLSLWKPPRITMMIWHSSSSDATHTHTSTERHTSRNENDGHAQLYPKNELQVPVNISVVKLFKWGFSLFSTYTFVSAHEIVVGRPHRHRSSSPPSSSSVTPVHSAATSSITREWPLVNHIKNSVWKWEVYFGVFFYLCCTHISRRGTYTIRYVRQPNDTLRPTGVGVKCAYIAICLACWHFSRLSADENRKKNATEREEVKL